MAWRDWVQRGAVCAQIAIGKVSAKLQDYALDSETDVTTRSILEEFKQSEKAFGKGGIPQLKQYTALLEQQKDSCVEILNVSKEVRALVHGLTAEKAPTTTTVAKPEHAALASLEPGDVVKLVKSITQGGRHYPSGTVGNVIEALQIGSGDGTVWAVKVMAQHDRTVLRLKQFHTFVLLGSKSVDLKLEAHLAENVQRALGVNEGECGFS